VIADLLIHSWTRLGLKNDLLQHIIGKLSLLETNEEQEGEKKRIWQTRIIAICLEHMVLDKLNHQLSSAVLEEFFAGLFEQIASLI